MEVRTVSFQPLLILLPRIHLAVSGVFLMVLMASNKKSGMLLDILMQRTGSHNKELIIGPKKVHSATDEKPRIRTITMETAKRKLKVR